jgi:hypothetical protein
MERPILLKPDAAQLQIGSKPRTAAKAETMG